jgi:hypothetical protein
MQQYSYPRIELERIKSCLDTKTPLSDQNVRTLEMILKVAKKRKKQIVLRVVDDRLHHGSFGKRGYDIIEDDIAWRKLESIEHDAVDLLTRDEYRPGYFQFDDLDKLQTFVALQTRGKERNEKHEKRERKRDERWNRIDTLSPEEQLAYFIDSYGVLKGCQQYSDHRKMVRLVEGVRIIATLSPPSRSTEVIDLSEE